MNCLTLLEGRMPETANECVVAGSWATRPCPAGHRGTPARDYRKHPPHRIYVGPGADLIFFCQSRDQHCR